MVKRVESLRGFRKALGTTGQLLNFFGWAWLAGMSGYGGVWLRVNRIRIELYALQQSSDGPQLSQQCGENYTGRQAARRSWIRMAILTPLMSLSESIPIRPVLMETVEPHLMKSPKGF